VSTRSIRFKGQGLKAEFRAPHEVPAHRRNRTTHFLTPEHRFYFCAGGAYESAYFHQLKIALSSPMISRLSQAADRRRLPECEAMLCQSAFVIPVAASKALKFHLKVVA